MICDLLCRTHRWHCDHLSIQNESVPRRKNVIPFTGFLVSRKIKCELKLDKKERPSLRRFHILIAPNSGYFSKSIFLTAKTQLALVSRKMAERLPEQCRLNNLQIYSLLCQPNLATQSEKKLVGNCEVKDQLSSGFSVVEA